METRRGLQMKQLLCLAHLLLLTTGSAVAQTCAMQSCPLCLLCDAASQYRFNSGRNQTAQVMCGASGQGAVTWERLDASTGQPIMELSPTVDGPKYRGGGNRLDILNVVAGDEGPYQCSYQTSGGPHTTCVFVLGRAVFASCGAQDCGEGDVITVQAGEPVMIDARITFINWGPCMMPQETEFLQLFKGALTPENLLYDCRDTATCPSGSGAFQPVTNGSHGFTIFLRKENAMSADEGDYVVRARINSRSGVAIIEKSVHVSVNGSVPSTTPTVISGPSTTSSSQSLPTTSITPTTTNATIPSTGGTDGISTGQTTPSGAIIAAAVVVSVVVVAAIAVGAVIIVVCVVRSSSQKGSHALLTVTQTTIREQNKYYRAESVVTTQTTFSEEADGKYRDSVIEPYEYYEAEDPAKSSEDHSV